MLGARKQFSLTLFYIRIEESQTECFLISPNDVFAI